MKQGKLFEKQPVAAVISLYVRIKEVAFPAWILEFSK